MKMPIADPRNTTGGKLADQYDDDLQAVVAPAPGATGESTTRAVRRRGFLKSLGGGGLLAAGGLVPAKWAKPVVAFVVLPAHAQTSSQHDAQEPDEPDEPVDLCESHEPAAPECNLPLTMSDQVVSCSEQDFGLALVATIDDTEDCPRLVVTTGASSSGSFTIIRARNSTVASNNIKLFVHVGDTVSQTVQTCYENVTPNPSFSESRTLQVMPASGCVAWTLSFTLVRTASSLAVRNIQVYPT